jgi:hypothetical protein
LEQKMNVHTPQRGTKESFTEFKARRAQSNAILKSMHRGPHQAPALNQFDVSRFFLGVHTNPSKQPSRRDKHRAAVARLASQATKPKAVRERKHIQRPHATRDEIGAVTLIGPRVDFEGVHPGPGWFILSGTSDGCYTARRIWATATFRGESKVPA